SVEITDNPPGKSESAAGTLYAARYDFAPDRSGFEGSATSADGSNIAPNTVASAKYWTLSQEGLAGITYSACLDITGVTSINVPSQLVLVQRGGAGKSWTPYASTLESSETLLCASGLVGFGDLGIGADEAANPVPIEDEFSAEVPTEFALSAAYPNPFNPTTNFNLDVARSDYFSIRVFDVTGRLVATLLEGTISPGRHRLTFDGAGLPSGIYFIKLAARTSGINITRTVTLLE
ncbi:MAG: T9SS type A sorting domain-containing protein, partial [Pirellulaceae bacterium]